MTNVESLRIVLDAANTRGQTAAMRFSPLLLAVVACVQPLPPTAPTISEVIYSHDATTWFEEYSGRATSISPDGRRLVFVTRSGARLIDVEHGVLPMEVWASVDEVTHVAIRPSGDVAVRGRRGTETGWFERERTGRVRKIDVPATSIPVWSTDGESIAYQAIAGSQSMVHVMTGTERRAIPLPARATAIAWYPDASALLVMIPQRTGLSALHRMDARTGELRVLADGLDAEGPRRVTLSIATDGARAYVALASAGAPPPEDRHDPHADRDLDIYEVDLTRGTRRVVAATTGDDTNPLLVGGNLYWTSAQIEASLVALPAEGGAPRSVVEHAQMPRWHPNGRQLGYFYGDWRAADWAINWDGGAVPGDRALPPVG